MATTSIFTNKLRGQNVLILGGTSGVGLSVTSILLEQGANIIISSSRQTKLNEALTILKQSHPTVAKEAITGYVCDLGSPEVENHLNNLLEQVSNHLSSNAATTATATIQHKQLDHLVYTAGDRLPTVQISEVNLPNFNSALQVRAASALIAVKTFLPLLKKAYTSTITLTSGSIAEKPIAGGWSILAFVGAGLTGLTRQLAFDLSPVRVNCVAPGVVDTDLWSNMDQSAKGAMFDGLAKSLPTGRVPNADDLAESYLYLLRDRNVTGHVVHSNGGAFLV